MPKTISVSELAEKIADAISTYDKNVVKKIKLEVKSAAETCKGEIRKGSPIRSGTYKKGWRVKKLYESDDDIRVVVWNKPRYMLTHLLEEPHNINRGGRMLGKTKAHPHIVPAAERASKLLEKKVKVVVKNG